MFGCSSSSRDVEARVVNNALVVKLLTADPPRVWRADMTGLATATLELREGQPGRFRLVMKTGAGKEEDISTFADREAATNALRVVTDAMLQGDGGSSSRGGYVSAAASGGGALRPVLWVVGIVVVVWFFGGVFVNALHNSGGMHKLPTDIKQGTAVPADKIFGGK